MRLNFFKLVFLLTTLLFSQYSIAETDLLNLSAYQEGDTPTYGDNIIMEQDENTEVKWISCPPTALENGKITFPVNLSGDFEVFIRISPGYYDFQAGEELFLISDEYRIKLSLSDLEIQAGDTTDDLGESDAWQEVNDIRLSIINNIAKVYLNDVFDGKITLKPNQVYNKLSIQNIDNNTSAGVTRIYDLKISGGTATTTTPETTTPENNTTTTPIPTTSTNCNAKYDAFVGRVIIPCIEVPDAFGGIQLYHVEMEQQPNTFSFDLDMNSIKPVQ